MSWLPCIRRGSDRWWLPLSPQTADVLAAALIADSEDPRRLALLVEQLQVDPPLLIFTALATRASEASLAAPPSGLTLRELAQGLSEQLASLLANGDSALAVPEPLGSERDTAEREALVPRWEQLQRTFLLLPRSQWLAAAGDWLELTGPPIPAAWRQAWPQIADEAAQPSDRRPVDISYAPSQLDLAALARTLRRGRSLENAFLDSLREAKRAALKQFAYGLSHEINNPLANISTRAQTLLRDEQDAGRGKSLQRIIDQTMRAHEMVADLMFYAHPPTVQQNSVDLQAVLRSVVNQSLESVQGRCIELVISPASQRVSLVADRGMLIEAVRSLLRNAIEAVGCDGQVQLSCQHQPEWPIAPPPDQPNPSTSPVESGPVALITVSDSGPGLSEAARVHAFDPYFSGREAGRGLGVGLCRVERIADLHRGGVSLHSGPAGCTARLWIPLAR